jgi:hypothetical protein
MTQTSTTPTPHRGTSNEEEQMTTRANENGSLGGKVAFVTGGASGIGRAAALAFAAKASAWWSPMCPSGATRKRPA